MPKSNVKRISVKELFSAYMFAQGGYNNVVVGGEEEGQILGNDSKITPPRWWKFEDGYVYWGLEE